MNEVGANSNGLQGSGSNQQTGNPQNIGSQSLQNTQKLQGSGGVTGVLGLTDVLNQPTSNELEVDTGNATAATEQQVETTPITPTSFNAPAAVLLLGGILIIIGAFTFVWSQRHANH